MNKNIKLVFLTGFFFSLHLAMVSYINSSFLSSFFSEGKVGILYVISSLASILTLLLIPKILPRLGGYKFLLYSSLFNALMLFSLSLSHNAYITGFMFVAYWISNSLIVFALDEILEIVGEGFQVGRVRGIYLTILNTAWVLSQLASSQILIDFSFSLLYLIACGIMLLFFFIILLSMRNCPDPKYDKVPAFGSVVKFFRNKNLSRAYAMNFLLQFFFSWMVIYTPIYLSLHLGFTWSEISIIFTIMLTAFIITQYPLGTHSDKVGERKMLVLGFLVLSLATLSLFFITKHTVLIWAIILFCTRLGAAAIEIMSDVYFFKHIKKENDEFVGIYRNTASAAYILGPLSASVLLFVIPSFKFIFLILGAIMLSGIYLASTIKKNDI